MIEYTQLRRRFYLSLTSLSFLFLFGCASYVTPGGSVQLSTLAEPDINKLLAKKPTATFPVNIAVARLQASGYSSYRNESYGTGRYSVVTAKDVESEKSFARLGKMPKVNGIATMNRILLPPQLDSLKELRTAAARLRADILLIYTFDTTFRVGSQKFGPLNAIALGMLPNKEVVVTTTASAALFDVRTEFLYGLAEATERESKYASVWGSSSAVDDLRVVTEKKAFQALIPEIEKTWGGIVKEYSTQ